MTFARDLPSWRPARPDAWSDVRRYRGVTCGNMMCDICGFLPCALSGFCSGVVLLLPIICSTIQFMLFNSGCVRINIERPGINLYMSLRTDIYHQVCIAVANYIQRTLDTELSEPGRRDEQSRNYEASISSASDTERGDAEQSRSTGEGDRRSDGNLCNLIVILHIIYSTLQY